MKKVVLVMVFVVLMAGMAFADGVGTGVDKAYSSVPLATTGWYCGNVKKCEWDYSATDTNGNMTCTFTDGSYHYFLLTTIKYSLYVAAVNTGHYLCSYYDTTVGGGTFTAVVLANHS
ncbi:MAG: hypothetical protein HQK97_12190 [Nitrospirae bacterium]|nr:hypothetical protein [Nitrospirota bacterium]